MLYVFLTPSNQYSKHNNYEHLPVLTINYLSFLHACVAWEAYCYILFFAHTQLHIRRLQSHTELKRSTFSALSLRRSIS